MKQTELRNQMFKKDITQARLARAMKLNPSKISLFIHGWLKLPDEKVKKIYAFVKKYKKKQKI